MRVPSIALFLMLTACPADKTAFEAEIVKGKAERVVLLSNGRTHYLRSENGVYRKNILLQKTSVGGSGKKSDGTFRFAIITNNGDEPLPCKETDYNIGNGYIQKLQIDNGRCLVAEERESLNAF